MALSRCLDPVIRAQRFASPRMWLAGVTMLCRVLMLCDDMFYLTLALPPSCATPPNWASRYHTCVPPLVGL